MATIMRSRWATRRTARRGEAFVRRLDDDGLRESEERAARGDVNERIEREVALFERRRQVGRGEEIARLESEIEQAAIREHEQSARRAKVVDRRTLEDRHGSNDALARLKGVELELAFSDGASVARIGARAVHDELRDDRDDEQRAEDQRVASAGLQAPLSLRAARSRRRRRSGESPTAGLAGTELPMGTSVLNGAGCLRVGRAGGDLDHKNSAARTGQIVTVQVASAVFSR